MKSNLINIDYDELIHETELAYLLLIDDEEIWLPKSQCELDEDEKVVTMKERLAEEKGLI